MIFLFEFNSINILHELWLPLKDVIIINLFEIFSIFFFTWDCLQSTWTLLGGMYIVDFGHDFYMVNFGVLEDHQ